MQTKEVTKLVELTEEFVEYLTDLYHQGILTKQQYEQLTKKKIEFINQRRSIVSR